MAAIIPKNPDLPSSYQVPGVYLYLSTQGVGPTQANRRVLFYGYTTAAGTARPNEVFQIPDEETVTNKSGKGSMIVRAYKTYMSQGTAAGELWGCAVPAPAGTAQTTLLNIVSAPSAGAPGSNLTAQSSGLLTVWIEGYSSNVIISNGDSLALIAANLYAEIKKVEDFLSATITQIGTPITLGAATSTITLTAKTFPLSVQLIQGVGISVPTSHTFVNGALIITLGTDGAGAAAGTPSAIKTDLDTDPTVAAAITYTIGVGTNPLSTVATTLLPFNNLVLTGRHAAQTSQDIPIVISFSNATTGIAVSPGTFTLAGNAAASPGVHSLLVTTQSVAYLPVSGSTPTASATGFAAAINAASAYPVTAAASAGVVTLYLLNGRNWNRPSVATTDGSQTIVLSAGVLGVGLPNLTESLNQISKLDAFRIWVTDFVDSTSLSTLYSYIEQQANGRIQKGQDLVFCDTERLTTAGAIPVSTTPQLTTSPRYFLNWCSAIPQQGYEIAARVAAIITSQDYLPFNFMSAELKTTPNVPLLLPDPAVRPTDLDINAAIGTYFMTPIVVDSQQRLVISTGRTTAKPSAQIDARFAYWGLILTLDYFRDDLGAFLFERIKGKNIKLYSDPNTSNVITIEGVKGLIISRMFTWENLDLLDGADQLKDLVAVSQNPQNPSRVDATLPLRVPVPLEQIGIFAQQVS
jgi:phage tail sheath gpL-like